MLYRFTALVARPASRALFNKTFQPTNTRTLTKSIFFRSSTTQFLQTHSFHHSRLNYFASTNDWNEQKQPTHPLIEKLKQHPHIMEQLLDLTSLLQTKGVNVSGKNPSYMQIIKVMSDPEIKEKVQKLTQALQGAGIQIDMNTIQELQSIFPDMAKEYESVEPTTEEILDEKKPVIEEERGRKRGVISKVKGLFKK
ncbi:hypothetical protein BD770DRAFT_326530 [Pilaira anomala]|nr:hypothetical protein BD770DRAFT_326530 [Pilaira anomala]